MPVHEQIATDREPPLQRVRITASRCAKQCVQRRVNVAFLGYPPFDRADLARTFDSVADLAGDRNVPTGVTQRDVVTLPGGDQLLGGVLSDRLEHGESVARAVDPYESLPTMSVKTTAASRRSGRSDKPFNNSASSRVPALRDATAVNSPPAVAAEQIYDSVGETSWRETGE